MLKRDRMRIEQTREDTALLAPIPAAKEQHLHDLRLQERILDVPGRGQERQTPDEHLVPP